MNNPFVGGTYVTSIFSLSRLYQSLSRTLDVDLGADHFTPVLWITYTSDFLDFYLNWWLPTAYNTNLDLLPSLSNAHPNCRSLELPLHYQTVDHNGRCQGEGITAWPTLARQINLTANPYSIIEILDGLFKYSDPWLSEKDNQFFYVDLAELKYVRIISFSTYLWPY